MDSLVLALLNLYFPEDKTEYIPAVIWFLLFLLGAIAMMWLIFRVSKKEARKAKELEEKLAKKGGQEGNS
ncbi:preprotein translocase subunit YajC [Bacillus sp. FJAT-27245]|uniref:preprotein translocase subunit YajC n=1 Tax=Bacillus sp. FJAT-27245 TaxID=1684144 RepID=UPI0006A776E0|nr:preprotein translocase subunit YajC [Bacillus sp. FJAT-27245]